jgi:hypothetical protein
MPLLSVFVVGCVSGALLLSFWRGDSQAVPSSKRGADPRIVEALPFAAPSSKQATREDAADAREAEPRAPVNDQSHGTEAPSPKDEAIAAESAAEPGSSVADVLLSLEAAYRQGLEVARAVEPTTAQVSVLPRATAAISEAPAPAPAPPAPAPPIAPTSPAVALAAPAAPAAIPPPASVPSVEAAPALASKETVRLRDVHVGDVHQSNSVSTVNHGDVFLLQQLAILQNLQLYGLSPYGRATAPAHTPRGTTRRAPPFPTSLTNPDNPWGFDFPPTVLVK